jgi:hypothetical protein
MMMIRTIWNLLLTFLIFMGLVMSDGGGGWWEWRDTSKLESVGLEYFFDVLETSPPAFWYWLFILLLWRIGRLFKKAGDKATAKSTEIRAENKAKQEKHIDMKLEEAEKEIESGDVDEKLWKRAFVEADGDIQKQKAIYMKYRTK